MISKRIDRSTKSPSFTRLGYYLLEAKTQDAQILWTLDLSQNGNAGKVLWTRLSNCEAVIPILAIAEIEATQAQNTRSKSDKTYHLVISFPQGERPTREQLEDIEDTLCHVMGFEGHQRISALHQDTDNLHLHVAINKIHPQTLTILNPWLDNAKRDKACRLLEIKHGLLIDNGMGQGQGNGHAQDMEAFTGEESLLSWVKAQLKEPLKQVQSWDEVHALLSQHDLTIKPRGAGLVIATAEGKIHIKASSIDRSLSLKALTDRLGVYQPFEKQGQTNAPNQKQTYQQGPKDTLPGNSLLWQKYQKEKDAFTQARTLAYTQLRTSHTQYCQDLKTWYKNRRISVKNNGKLSRKSKFELYQDYFQEMKADFSQQRQLETKQRQTIRENYPPLTWDQWLTQQVNQGNEEALTLLRKREATSQKFTEALLTVQTLDEAKIIIFAHLKPITRKNGDVVYQVKDGGIVEDTQKGVYVPTVTDASTLLALMIVAERFPGKPLIAEGSTHFKAKVAELSAKHEFKVRFADESTEQKREYFQSMGKGTNQYQQPKVEQQKHLREQNKKGNYRGR
jgi:hypothetical protein